MFLDTDLSNYQLLIDEYTKEIPFYNVIDLQAKIQESVDTFYALDDPEKNAQISDVKIDDGLLNN